MNGQVVPATVLAIRPFGTFVAAGGRNLLVHMWDQSWYWPFAAERHFRVGETRDVWVGEVKRNRHPVLIASFQLARPDLDPRLKYSTRSIVAGTVRESDSAGVSVEFDPGQFADFRVVDVMRAGKFAHDCKVGDPFRVKVVHRPWGVIVDVYERDE